MRTYDLLQQRDALHAAHDQAQQLVDHNGGIGFGIITLLDGDGQMKTVTPFTNLITDAGDLYYAQKMIVGISPAAATAPTAVNGMKLGTTSTTSPSKNGTGAALQAYLTGSNSPFDSSYPQTANLGAGLGVYAVYQTTWGSGLAATIVEAAIINDQGTNLTSNAGSTISRTTFAAQVKATSDTLAITWNHKNLGA